MKEEKNSMDNNKDEVNSPMILNDEHHQASSQRFKIMYSLLKMFQSIQIIFK